MPTEADQDHRVGDRHADRDQREAARRARGSRSRSCPSTRRAAALRQAGCASRPRIPRQPSSAVIERGDEQQHERDEDRRERGPQRQVQRRRHLADSGCSRGSRATSGAAGAARRRSRAATRQHSHRRLRALAHPLGEDVDGDVGVGELAIGQEREDGDGDEVLDELVVAGNGRFGQRVARRARGRHQHERDEDQPAEQRPVCDDRADDRSDRRVSGSRPGAGDRRPGRRLRSLAACASRSRPARRRPAPGRRTRP